MLEPTPTRAAVTNEPQWNWRALREPTVLLTATYLAASAIGLWASYCFYKPFGIPILDYMQPSDFLVAALHDPMYFLVVIIGAALSWLGSRIDVFREGRPERVAVLRERWWGTLVGHAGVSTLARHAVGSWLYCRIRIRSDVVGRGRVDDP